MTAPLDPKRWTAPNADVPADLARLLRGARDELGTPDEVAELARRLTDALGPEAGLSHGAPLDGADLPGSHARSAAQVAARGSGRIALWTAAGTTALAGVWLAASWLSAPAALPPPAVSPAVPSSPAPAPVAPPDTAPLAPPIEREPAAPPEREPGDDAASAGEHVSQRASSSGRATRRGGSMRASGTLAEATLLDRARAALSNDPTRALALTDDHQRRFPRGALTEEREVIATLALKRLGRQEEASERAAAFERRYRRSVHRPRLDRSTDTSSPTDGTLNTAPAEPGKER